METMVEKVLTSQENAFNVEKNIVSIVDSISQTAERNTQIYEISEQQKDQFVDLMQYINAFMSTFEENSHKVKTTATIVADIKNIKNQLANLMEGYTFSRDSTEDTPEHLSEQRRNRRITYPLRVNVQLDGKLVNCISNDLSLSGIQLRHEVSFEKGSTLAMQVFLPYDDEEEYKKQTPLSINGIVRWCGDHGDPKTCGIEFVNVTSHHKAWLKECFQFFDENIDSIPLNPVITD